MTRQQLRKGSKKNSAQDTQLLDVSPQQIKSENTEIIIVKYIYDLTAVNINPLTQEDMKNILDQSTLQENLCDNLVLVSEKRNFKRN